MLISENVRVNTEMIQSVLLKSTQAEQRAIKRDKQHDQRDVRESLRGFNLTPYFPASSLTILNEFMSNKDGDFQQKKEEFERYLNSVATVVYDMDNFCAALLKTLFNKNFIKTHRWPTSE